MPVTLNAISVENGVETSILGKWGIFFPVYRIDDGCIAVIISNAIINSISLLKVWRCEK